MLTITHYVSVFSQLKKEKVDNALPGLAAQNVNS